MYTQHWVIAVHFNTTCGYPCILAENLCIILLTPRMPKVFALGNRVQSLPGGEVLLRRRNSLRSRGRMGANTMEEQAWMMPWTEACGDFFGVWDFCGFGHWNPFNEVYAYSCPFIRVWGLGPGAWGLGPGAGGGWLWSPESFLRADTL